MSKWQPILNEIETKGHFMDGFKYLPFEGPFENFMRLLEIQEGGLSDWGADSASNYVPPVPHSDGKYYHTNRGFIWPTFQLIAGRYGFPNSPADFYNLSKERSREIRRAWFLGEFQYTSNETINIFCFYIAWGGGWYNRFNYYYKQLAQKSLIQDFDTKDWNRIFKTMAQARINDLMVIAAKPNYRNTSIPFLWPGAIQIFYREFSPQVKKKV